MADDDTLYIPTARYKQRPSDDGMGNALVEVYDADTGMTVARLTPDQFPQQYEAAPVA